MTTLVNANEVFTQIVSTKKRNTWSGSARSVPSQVISRSQPIKLSALPLNVSGSPRTANSAASNSLDTLILCGNSQVFTTSDLITYTGRTLTDSIYSGFNPDIMYYDGVFFAAFYGATGPQYRLSISTNKGVTWSSGPSPLATAYQLAMTVVAGKAYFVNVTLNSFWILTSGTGATIAKSFSRYGNWANVFGTATKQYCIGGSSGNGYNGSYVDSSTNGLDFTQDTAMQTFIGSCFMTGLAKYGFSLGNGGAMILALDSSSRVFKSAYCGSDNVWKEGFSIPTLLPNGNIIQSIQYPGSSAFLPRSYSDSDGFTYIPIQTVDPSGNFYQAILRIYDGKTVDIIDKLFCYQTSSNAYTSICPHPTIAGSFVLPVTYYLMMPDTTSKEVYYEI